MSPYYYETVAELESGALMVFGDGGRGNGSAASPGLHRQLLGMYLFLLGTVALAANAFALFLHAKCRGRLLRRSESPRLGLLAVNAASSLLIPLYGAAAITGISSADGSAGCLGFAVLWKVVGLCQLLLPAFMARHQDRLAKGRRYSDWASRTRHYPWVLCGVAAYAVFWAVLPLLGLGRYALHPGAVHCDLDWQRPDKAFAVYVTGLGLCCWAWPLSQTAQYSWSAHRRFLTGRNARLDLASDSRPGTLLVLGLLGTYAGFLPYAVLAGLSLGGARIPAALPLVASAAAKTVNLWQTLFYVFASRHVKVALLSLVGRERKDEEEEEESEQRRLNNADEGPAQDRSPGSLPLKGTETLKEEEDGDESAPLASPRYYQKSNSAKLFSTLSHCESAVGKRAKWGLKSRSTDTNLANRTKRILRQSSEDAVAGAVVGRCQSVGEAYARDNSEETAEETKRRVSVLELAKKKRKGSVSIFAEHIIWNL